LRFLVKLRNLGRTNRHPTCVGDLTCRAIVALVGDHLDGALPAAERAAFEAHVAGCRDCRLYLRTYRDAVALAKAAAVDDEVPSDMPEDLVRAILAARGRR
jgi:anti-sigma factor RsiW